MPEKDVITIGAGTKNSDTLTVHISQSYIIEEDGRVSINFNKEENEDKIVEILDSLIVQEEENLTGNNINRIQELLNKLPFEEERIKMTYRKDDIVKSLKVKNGMKEIQNNISNLNVITKLEELLSIMNKYMELNEIDKNNKLDQIQENLVKLHNDKFAQLLNKENYSLKSVDDNIYIYENLQNQIKSFDRNIRFVSNDLLKQVINEEISSLNNVKSSIENEIVNQLQCDASLLEQAIKSRKLINSVNTSNSQEQIDVRLIENNFIDYINLGQEKRRKALVMFMNNKKKYNSVAEINSDLAVIVSTMKKQEYNKCTIEF